VYDPNNYMMDPQKYLRPDQLGKAGGWTYNKDWRRNTNFTPEAVGQWQLVLTPEVAASWLPDTRRPETYPSFWTPEAVMARYEAQMAAIQKSSDSLIAVYAAANAAAGTANGSTNTSTSATGSAGTTTETATTTGSGTTGAIGTGGVSSATSTDSTTSGSHSIVPFALTAVNGNKFMLPTLNMYIDNGSFTAYTGCNSAVGNIVVNGPSVKFEQANTNTNVECIGGFDQSAFIERLKRADSYDVVNNQFRLKQGDQVLMIFAKTAL
jgi:heat shock protein HslJ